MQASNRLAILVALSVVVAGCQAGTRPTEPDRDADGLPDSAESGGWNITVRRTVAACFSDVAPPEETKAVQSNVLLIDSDSDGVDDFVEFQLRSDPNDNDTDDDGLTDAEEVALQTSEALYAGPLLRLNDADSDDDCLSDGAEVDGHLIPGIGLRVTDPTFANSDGDGWTDAWEIHRSKTDPTNVDTDGDEAEDHFDADPLRDLWLRFDLVRLRVKEATGSQRIDVAMDWFVPTTPPTTRPMPRPTFNVAVNQDALVPANNSPGLVNLDDRQGGSLVEFNVQAFRVNAQDSGTPIDINPYDPFQPVSWRFNVATAAWSFRDASGNHTTEARLTVLDTPRARLEFALAAQGPP